MSHIALPLNLLLAIAPPALIAVLEHFGGSAVMVLTFSCSLLAFIFLALLRRLADSKKSSMLANSG